MLFIVFLLWLLLFRGDDVGHGLSHVGSTVLVGMDAVGGDMFLVGDDRMQVEHLEAVLLSYLSDSRDYSVDNR